MSHLLKLQRALAENDWDGLLLISPENRRYATGFHTSAGAVLVTPAESFFFTDFRYVEAAKEHIKDYTVLLSGQTNPLMDAVKKAVAASRIKRLGYEEDRVTVSRHEAWRKAVKAQWQPAGDALAVIRSSKDSWEVDCMRKAQRITEEVFTQVLPLIREGMTERELCAEIVYRCLKNGADGISFDPIVVGGPNSSKPHGEPGSRRFQAGDFITMDFGCLWKGYCSDMTRTVALGHATEEMRTVYQTVLSAQQAGIAAAKAGVVGKTIDAAARKIIDDAGYGECFGHGFGHGIGLEVHEPFGASPSEERTLPAGCVISAEPGVYLPGRFGVRIEDLLLLQDGGNQNLTMSPKELIIL